MVRPAWYSLCAILALGLALAPGWAQSPAPSASAAPVADPADTTGELYTAESFTKQLKEMGFEATVDKEGTILLTHKKGDVETVIFFNLGDHVIWMGQQVVEKVKDPEKVAPEKYAKLLELGETYGPTHVTYNKEQTSLNLYRGLSRRLMPAKLLDQQINEFVTHIKETEPLWGPSVFPVEAAK